MLATAVIALLAFAGTASAATFTVDNASNAVASDDCTVAPGDCSLRGAIIHANVDSTLDTIIFAADYTISINTPLPDAEQPLLIDDNGMDIVVEGSGSYSCAGSDYAFDLTSAAAVPARVRGLAFNDVCGRALLTNVGVPTIQVGPRRYDNSVPITGVTGGGTEIDVFRADAPAIAGEALSFFQAASGASGSYYLLPSPTPSAGQRFVATTTGAIGTSGYSAAAVTPSDLVSPSFINAVAVSNNRVRLDFDETIAPGAAPPSAFAITIGNAPRAVTGTSVYGNSIFLDSNQPWNTGEAGTMSFTGNGRVTDIVGNELLGQPSSTVYAGPGEINAPVISSYRVSPQKFCQRRSSACRRGATYAYFNLNKDARVIFRIYKGIRKTRELVTFVRRLKAGRNKVKLTASVSGRTLPASVMTLRATAQDVARTYSTPVDGLFRVVKKNRDL